MTFLVFGPVLAGLFTANAAVVESARLYLWIVSASLGLRGVHQIMWTALNVLNRPLSALVLELILAFGLWIPFAFAGAGLAQMAGVYAGLSAANIVAGIIAIVWANRVIGIENRKRKFAG